MEPTRIDTKKLTAAVAKAAAKIEEAEALLGPYLVTLTDKERASTLRPRDGFPDAGRAFARAISAHPEVGQAVAYDGAAVVEDLDNVQALAPLQETLARFVQRASDSKLAWLAEAYGPSLAAYAVAKVRAQKDGALRAAIEPLEAMLATGRRKKAAPAAT